MEYIVEVTNGNPRILQRQTNGTYEVITHGAGEKTVDDLLTLVERANDWVDSQ